MSTNSKKEVFSNLNSAVITSVLCFILVSLCIKTDAFSFGFIELLFIVGLALLTVVNIALAYINYKLFRLSDSPN